MDKMLLSRAALIKGFSGNAGMENTAIHEFCPFTG